MSKSREFGLPIIEVLKRDISKFDTTFDPNTPSEGLLRSIYMALALIYPLEGIIFASIVNDLAQCLSGQTGYRPDVLYRGIKDLEHYQVLTINNQIFRPTQAFIDKFS